MMYNTGYMESKKTLKETKLGIWLKGKAPKIYDAALDALPDSGVIGFVKNLVDKDESITKDPAYYAALHEAERIAQEAITARWESDNDSGNRLAQMVRPVTLIALLTLYTVLAVVDSVNAWDFEVKEQYINLLEILSLTAFGAYFAGRSYEKTKM